MIHFESEFFPVKKKNFDIKKLLTDVQCLFEPSFYLKNISFTIHYAEKLMTPTLFGVRIYLYRILINLISNAIKFTEPKGSITMHVSMEADPNECTQIILHLSLHDTGIGIPPDQIATIFDRYSRVPEHVHYDDEGMGIGLDIVKKLVTDMGGSVQVTSELNKGTTFFVSLPFTIAVNDDSMIQEKAEAKLLECLMKLIPDFEQSLLEAYSRDDQVMIKKILYQFYGGLCYTNTPQLNDAVKNACDSLEQNDIEAFLTAYEAIGHAIHLFKIAYEKKFI